MTTDYIIPPRPSRAQRIRLDEAFLRMQGRDYQLIEPWWASPPAWVVWTSAVALACAVFALGALAVAAF